MKDAEFDVAVVGAGVAGMAAALFAGERGLRTVQVGNGGGILFASGPLDLMGVHPVAEARTWSDPYAAIEAVVRDVPGHPYGRVPPDDIRRAMAAFVGALEAVGLPYGAPGSGNSSLVTALGTVKTTYCVPRSMAAGVDALRARRRGLLVGFRGMREFSAQGVAATLGSRWPGLRAVRVAFPPDDAPAEAVSAHIARALDLEAGRAALAELVRPHLGDAEVVGFPSVLGLGRATKVLADLEARLGVPVFEIPTMPTSVPGLRLKDALETALAIRGVVRHVQATVPRIETPSDGPLALHVRGSGTERVVRARAVVLATGRFFGRGLVADRHRVREPILDLLVSQPESRADWHATELLAPAGHALDRAGVETDAQLRPLDQSGRVAHPRIFAAGTLLAHQDWAREKCGSGLAIATAWAAVEGAAR